jgi:hypothetical protein
MKTRILFVCLGNICRFRPFFEVIVLKNDRSVFTNDHHPKNQPGYQVKLLG